VDDEGALVRDIGWQQLDPRKIGLDRDVGWIVTAVLSVAWLVAVAILSLIDNAPGWLWWAVALLWVPFTVAIGLLLYRWPPLEYRHSRYRVDDELIEIERGVVFRTAIAVPRSRVQHLDVTQGPLMRRYGLAQLSIYTAGAEFSQVALGGLAFEVAHALRDRLLPRGARADGI
jgi:membrane protein YdbS with pleckstrin-like domain